MPEMLLFLFSSGPHGHEQYLTNNEKKTTFFRKKWRNRHPNGVFLIYFVIKYLINILRSILIDDWESKSKSFHFRGNWRRNKSHDHYYSFLSSKDKWIPYTLCQTLCHLFYKLFKSTYKNLKLLKTSQHLGSSDPTTIWIETKMFQSWTLKVTLRMEI